MAKKITKYQAEDGTEFATEAEADHHDRKITARDHFQDQFVDTTRSGWDFTMAYLPEDSDVLAIGVNDLPDFLANNAARIQNGYDVAIMRRRYGAVAKSTVAKATKPTTSRTSKR